MEGLLLRNAVILPMKPMRTVLRGNVLIRDDRIAYVGTEEPRATRSLDLGGAAVVPGLIQVHVHLCQTMLRGSAEGRTLLSWLDDAVWPLEAAMDENDVYLSSLLGCAELLSGGTTAVLDMGPAHHVGSVFEACRTAGIRATSGNSIMDSPEAESLGLLVTPEEMETTAARLIKRWNGAAGGRLGYCYAPRFPLGCSQNLLAQVAEGSRRHGLLIHTHLAESEDEERTVRERFGVGGAQHLLDSGVLNSRTVVAHCVHTADSEWNILARTGAAVAHCPSSNLKLSSGVAPVASMLDRGIPVGLGADGAPCNNRLDVFEEMRLSALLASLRSGPGSVSAWAILQMATVWGARALGQGGELGTLEVGKKADIVAVDLAGYHCRPLDAGEAATTLVYCARAADVVLTMVDGEILYTRSGGLARVPEAELRGVEGALGRLRARAFGDGED